MGDGEKIQEAEDRRKEKLANKQKKRFVPQFGHKIESTTSSGKYQRREVGVKIWTDEEWQAKEAEEKKKKEEEKAKLEKEKEDANKNEEEKQKEEGPPLPEFKPENVPKPPTGDEPAR